MIAILVSLALTLSASTLILAVALARHYGAVAEDLAVERNRLDLERQQIDADWAALARARNGACTTLAECLRRDSCLRETQLACSYFEEQLERERRP